MESATARRISDGRPGSAIESPSPPPQRRCRASNSGVTVTRSEEHTSELQSLMRISYAVFCLKKKNNKKPSHQSTIKQQPIYTQLTTTQHHERTSTHYTTIKHN